MDSRFATDPPQVTWPHPVGTSVRLGSVLYPNKRQSCSPTSISATVVRGLASMETLFGLYNMVMKYPNKEGMLISVHMWASYRGDQAGMECFPRSLEALRTALEKLSVTRLNSSDSLIEAVMYSYSCQHTLA